VSDVSTAPRFAFGANWRDFLAVVDDARIAQAAADLARLVPGDAISGRTFLDIGSGSGLHALAALRLGAARVRAIDFDPDSVAATAALLEQHAARGPWVAERGNALELSDADGTFDVVYSWGVLHHTGEMWRAIDRAADRVAPGGVLAIALYRRTPLCWAWGIEKRVYTRSPRVLQGLARGVFKAAYALGLLATGRSPWRYAREYRSRRGMSWHHDVHDWLGGTPYESADPTAVAAHLAGRGFTREAVFNDRPRLGVFGTGCAEYRFQRTA